QSESRSHGQKLGAGGCAHLVPFGCLAPLAAKSVVPAHRRPGEGGPPVRGSGGTAVVRRLGVPAEDSGVYARLSQGRGGKGANLLVRGLGNPGFPGVPPSERPRAVTVTPSSTNKGSWSAELRYGGARRAGPGRRPGGMGGAVPA